MLRDLGNRVDAVNHYQKSEEKWERELKDLTKQKKMHFSISRRSSSCRELKNINNIKSKAYKKHIYSSSNNYSSDTDYLSVSETKGYSLLNIST